MSLRYVLFDLTLFARGDDPKESRKDLGWMLEALTQRDQAYLKEHPDTPLLYQSGVTYERPAQFQGLCPEASVLKNALGPMANDPQVADALETVQAALGGERFRDIGRIIENGSGDCLPVETLVEIAGDNSRCAIGDLQVGDVIRSMRMREDFATVNKIWDRSIKPTVTLFLDSGAKLISSLDHRHMVITEREHGFSAVERRAEDIKVGDPLVTRFGFGGVRVKAIEPSAARECVDITTSTGMFWLPESDVITHNCDNVATWRAAELRQNDIAASPFITWRKRPDGGYTYHVLVRWPDNTLEDPSLLLGMSQPERAADRDEEIRKNNERIDMVKAAAARKTLPTSVVGAGGHRNDHRNDHRNISQPVLIPWDEYGMVDLDLDLDDDGLERSFDERLLQHTGLLRGM
jgi:hypothetical protein